MTLLPDGLVVPPLPYVVALTIAAATIAVFLVSQTPRVQQRHVVAFTPWMVAGASAHVFYQIEIYPGWAEPLFAAPAVYVTTFIALGTIWTLLAFVASISAGEDDSVALYLGLVGTAALLALFVFAGWKGAFTDVKPFYSAAGVGITIPVTIVLYFAMAYLSTSVVARARIVGGLVIFAHALDGITTAIGIDVIGTAERSPLPEAIMSLAGQLPMAETTGVGWLFVLVKLLIAVAIIYAFADYLEEEPVRGNLAFAVIIALGLGPAVNNLLLFALRDAAVQAVVAG